MKGYLVDTNLLSELRRPKQSPAVVEWFSSVHAGDLFLSVLTLGEPRSGIESLRNTDPTAANALERWLTGICEAFSVGCHCGAALGTSLHAAAAPFH